MRSRQCWGANEGLQVEVSASLWGYARVRLTRLMGDVAFNLLSGPQGVEIVQGGEYGPEMLADALEFAAAAIREELAAPTEPDPGDTPVSPSVTGGSDDGRLVFSEPRRLAHDPSCRWAEKIADENFRTVAPAEALEVCARGCLVCSPEVG